MGLNPTIYHGARLAFAPFARIAAGRRVMMQLADGHSLMVSPEGLAAAGIDGPIDFPSSSALIDCYEDGTPTGHVQEYDAKKLVLDVIPPLTMAERVANVRATLASMAATGLTGAHVMELPDDALAILRGIEADGELPVRLRMHPVARQVDGDDVSGLLARMGEHGRRWAVTGVKVFMDGTIDGGTAWLAEPDLTGHSHAGAWSDMDAYRSLMGRLIHAGVNTATHAIGDAGVKAVIDTIHAIKAADPTPRAQATVHSIEHLEMLDDRMVRTVGASGIDVSMMPLHCTRFLLADGSDNWSRRLGEPREGHAFRLRSLIDAGATMALGSDWPVAPFDPRATLADGVLRRPFDRPGMDPVGPGEAIGVEEGLRGYTVNCAHARGEAGRFGVLAPGYMADLTVFGGDPLEADAAALGTIPVLGTVVGGEPVYTGE